MFIPFSVMLSERLNETCPKIRLFNNRVGVEMILTQQVKIQYVRIKFLQIREFLDNFILSRLRGHAKCLYNKCLNFLNLVCRLTLSHAPIVVVHGELINISNLRGR